MSTQSKVCGLAALAISGLLASSASAAAISVNFTGNGSAPSLAATDTAGVVPVANWNNADGTNNGSATAPKIFGGLIDDSGATVSGLTGTYFANNQYTPPASGVTGDYKMFRAYLEYAGDPTTVILAGIPYATYDVYVYFDGFNGEEWRSADYAVNGGAPVRYIDGANQNFAGTFVDAAITGTGNYFKVSNLSGNFSLTAVAGPSAANDRAALNGFQIVEAVPEPTSLALLGLATLGLAARRRRA